MNYSTFIHPNGIVRERTVGPLLHILLCNLYLLYPYNPFDDHNENELRGKINTSWRCWSKFQTGARGWAGWKVERGWGRLREVEGKLREVEGNWGRLREVEGGRPCWLRLFGFRISHLSSRALKLALTALRIPSYTTYIYVRLSSSFVLYLPWERLHFCTRLRVRRTPFGIVGLPRIS